MTAMMQALRLTAWGKDPELVLVPVPEPGPGELLLRVDAAGLCHSDLHVMDAAPGALPYTLPFTLGHEVAGTVVGLGAAVSTGWLDEPVAVHGVWSCGQCRRCRDGRENYCLRLTGPVGAGLGYDGGLAEYLLVPSERFLVRAGGVAAEQLAPLTDAGLTAYHSVRANLDAVTGEGVVLVVGVGGLGHLAIQVLSALSTATIVAVDPRESARSLAQQHGANRVHSELRALDLAGGVDLVLDFVGSDATLDQAAHLLAPGGRLVVVGSAGGSLIAAKGGALPRGWQLSAPFWGTRSDLEAVVSLAARGALAAETETGSLDDALELYKRLRCGEIRGRAVVVQH
jgi:propanol-preferring alcohol dehydrogenase